MDGPLWPSPLCNVKRKDFAIVTQSTRDLDRGKDLRFGMCARWKDKCDRESCTSSLGSDLYAGGRRTRKHSRSALLWRLRQQRPTLFAHCSRTRSKSVSPEEMKCRRFSIATRTPRRSCPKLIATGYVRGSVSGVGEFRVAVASSTLPRAATLQCEFFGDN